MSANLTVIDGERGERVPPYSLDAERSVLGGVFLDETSLAEVQILVRPADFFRESHRKVFEAMCSLSARNEPVDRVTVKAELVSHGALASIGGDDFVDVLDKIVPVSTNVLWYARIVADKALARRCIETAQAIVLQGYEGKTEARELVNDAEAKLFALREDRIGPGFRRAGELLKETLNAIQARGARDSAITGEASGLDALDKITRGWQPGTVVVVGARPSMGKTAFLVDCAISVCKRGGGVAIFSLEMSTDELIMRFLATLARVDSAKLATGQLSTPEWNRLLAARDQVAEWDLHILDDASMGIVEIRAHARRLSRQLSTGKHPLRLIGIDYIQLIEGTGDSDKREGEVAAISRGIKILAKQLSVPILALCQLNRGLEMRPDKRPRMSDLRESGALEQDADVIVFPFREEVYKPNDANLRGTAEMIVAKHRNGPLGMAEVAFIAQHSSFCNASGNNPPPHTDEDAQ